MRCLIFAFLILSFVSCEKEKEKIRILSACVGGDSLTFSCYAQRYRDVRNDTAFGFNYHIFNLESPMIYLEAYDSSFVEDYFVYPKVKAKYSFTNPFGKSVNYNSINGSLKLTNEKNGILFGVFDFNLVNIVDITDTLKIEKGHFEITLDENDRIW